MKIVFALLLVCFGVFCLFCSGMYFYMTLEHYSGGTYIRPIFQTAVTGIMSIIGSWICFEYHR
jgi:hypothetical protein